MAAPASRILGEMIADVYKMDHGFSYAPGMDAPYLDFQDWHNAYQTIQKLKDSLGILQNQATAFERTLAGDGYTAEVAANIHWERQAAKV
jgi:hypothetical protein